MYARPFLFVLSCLIVVGHPVLPTWGQDDSGLGRWSPAFRLSAAEVPPITEQDDSSKKTADHAHGILIPKMQHIENVAYFENAQEPVERPLLRLSESNRINGIDIQDDQLLDQPTSRKLDSSWAKRDIRQVRIDIRETAPVAPRDRSEELDYGGGQWLGVYFEPAIFNWVAPDIYYRQLYFQDVALERYGQTFAPSRQMVRSGVHFFTSVFTLPNKVCNDPPRTCDSPYGFCRPGSSAPLTITRHRFPVHGNR